MRALSLAVHGMYCGYGSLGNFYMRQQVSILKTAFLQEPNLRAKLTDKQDALVLYSLQDVLGYFYVP